MTRRRGRRPPPQSSGSRFAGRRRVKGKKKHRSAFTLRCSELSQVGRYFLQNLLKSPFFSSLGAAAGFDVTMGFSPAMAIR